MAESLREIAERLAGPHREKCVVVEDWASAACECDRPERVLAIEEALRARDEARDAEWCKAIWPENPEGAEPVGPEKGGETLREWVKALLRLAEREARRQGRESMREEAASACLTVMNVGKLGRAWVHLDALRRRILALPLEGPGEPPGRYQVACNNCGRLASVNGCDFCETDEGPGESEGR